MVGWQRHLQSVLRHVGKKVEHNYAASARFSCFPYEPSRLPGGLRCIQSLWSSPSTNMSRPLYQYLQQLNLIPCLRLRFTPDLTFLGKTFCSESGDKLNNPTCWNCNAVPKAVPFLFCDSCRTVQPVDHSVDYFQIFGLNKTYEIKDENLEGKYKDWQKKLHPDLVHSKSEEEREFAAEQSARVIEAYRTLTNPLSRAIYIMKLEGVDVNEEETVSDPELLTEIMEIREAVEDAADLEALNEIRHPVQEKMIHWSKSFANAFQDHNFDEALTCIQRMNYYDRVNKEITKKL